MHGHMCPKKSNCSYIASYGIHFSLMCLDTVLNMYIAARFGCSRLVVPNNKWIKLFLKWVLKWTTPRNIHCNTKWLMVQYPIQICYISNHMSQNNIFTCTSTECDSFYFLQKLVEFHSSVATDMTEIYTSRLSIDRNL